ncbi:MAG: hypothetical protein ACKVY0_18495 [Prosthecobacter sp.]|uniref:hypothetical protein n=1 Tax=Prosthecobacter sp. TaxID=1965333 RepID=UPI0039040CC6
MTTRQNATAQSLVRADEFVDTRTAADFTHTPPTKVDAKAAAAQTALKQAITDLGGKQAIQSGGGYAGSTQSQREVRAELLDELRDVVRTADAIAEETDNEALMDRFRMPGGSGDEELKARARGMAAAIRALALNDEFEAHGHGADTAADLEEMVADLNESEGTQAIVLGEQAGATAKIPGILKAGKTAVKTFNAIFHRLYADKLDLLTAWRTASHIERPERRKKPAPPAPPPAP